MIPITTPPLREHPEDIPLIIDHYSHYYAEDLKVPLKIFPDATLKELQSWQFKGNVRELRNFIERIYILISKQIIETDDIMLLGQKKVHTDFWNEVISFKEKKRQFETRYLSTQLRMHNGNVSKTALSLGLQVSNLSRKIKELEIKD